MGNLFDILGPVMVGPSSSHTAGAVRIGLIARQLFGAEPEEVLVGLHGSFAATGKGHGTDKALIAGLLGMQPDDMRIPDSFSVAREKGMLFQITNINIKGAHPNTARIIMKAEGKEEMLVEAYSIGGGRMIVCKIDNIDVNFTGESNTLIIRNTDKRGIIMAVSKVLNDYQINIASMNVFRERKGGMAVMVIETDQLIPKALLSDMQKEDGIIRVKYLPANGAA